MNLAIDRTDQHNYMNEVIGKNLRFIRKLKKMSLQTIATKIHCTYQQIGKYENNQNQVNSYKLWQLSQVLGVKIKYFFDDTYISRMKGFHGDKLFNRYSAIQSEDLDIDDLQEDMDREISFIDYKGANVNG